MDIYAELAAKVKKYPAITVETFLTPFYNKFFGVARLGGKGRSSSLDPHAASIRKTRGLREQEKAVWMWAAFHYKTTNPDDAPIAVKPTHKFINVYFEDLKDLVSFIDNKYDTISRVCFPPNKNWISKIDQNNCVIKRSLFFNAYRYRVLFNTTSPSTSSGVNYRWHLDEGFTKIHEWCKDSIFTDEDVERYFLRKNIGGPTLFLKHREDVAMVKIALATSIKSIEKIVLVNELEDENSKKIEGLSD